MVAALLLTSALPPASAAEPVPPVARFDHVAIRVADLDRSVGFYTKLFGFRQIPAPVPTARWLSMGGGATLHIVAGRTVPVATERWDHIAIAGGDMDAMIARLDAAQIAWSDINGKPRPQVRTDGVKQIFVRDPDGYWIEINDASSKDR